MQSNLKKKCRHCGNEIDENAKFCQHCGKSQEDSTEKSTVRLTLKNILRTLVALLFISFAIPAFVHGRLISGLIFCLGAYVSSPLFKKSPIYKKYKGSKFALSFALSSLVFLTGLIVYAKTISPAPAENNETLIVQATTAIRSRRRKETVTETTKPTEPVTTAVETVEEIVETEILTKEVSEPEIETEVTEMATEEITFSAEETSKFVKIYLDSVLGATLQNYNISYDSEANIYNISVWQDGVATGAALATNGDSSAWDSMKSAIVSTCKTLQTYVSEISPSSHVSIIVLNDLNTENTLLTVLDGVIIYDAVG